MTEIEFQRECIQLLTDHDWLILRVNSGRTSSGIPFVRWYCQEEEAAHGDGCSDLICLSPSGRFCAFELKQENNQPTELQERFLDSVNVRGGTGAVIRSLDELQEKIKGM